MKHKPLILSEEWYTYYIPILTNSNISRCNCMYNRIYNHYFRFYNSEQLLANLYFSLVKTSLDREDVETLEKENIKNSHEIRQAFRHSTKATDSYRYRTIAELIASIVLLVFFCGVNGIKGLNKPLFDCDVHGVLFKCVIPNSRFYYVS